MRTKEVYRYDSDGVYSGISVSFEDPMNEGEYLLPANCTVIAPPSCTEPYVPVWDGSKWMQMEDHRKHLNDKGNYEGGTPYWLPAEGDSYRTEARYMETLGALPEGAVTMKPEKTEAEELKESIESQISEAKNYLNSTDYAVIKCAENGLDIDTEYPNLRVQRQAARDKVNELEALAEAQGIDLAEY